MLDRTNEVYDWFTIRQVNPLPAIDKITLRTVGDFLGLAFVYIMLKH